MNRREAWMNLWGQVVREDGVPANGAPDPRRRRQFRPSPSSAVLVLLGAAVLLGGGRRLLRGWKSRKLIDRLNEEKPSHEAIEESTDFGRDALIDLFRILGSDQDETTRHAAGRALAKLWKDDELVAEEEKAVVRRGLVVDWRARKRYPRAMTLPIPIEWSYGVPFLAGEHPGILDREIEWSFQVTGAERASLEVPSPWRPGAGREVVTIDPADFPSDGPHRLVLKLRARQANRNPAWVVDLPHMSFQFEFDRNLRIESLLTLPDDDRARVFASALRLSNAAGADAEPAFSTLSREFVLRDPPCLVIDRPLPCDLAHRIEWEFEGIPERYRAGLVVVSGQGGRKSDVEGTLTLPIRIEPSELPGGFERPGLYRARARLTPDVQAAWAAPELRSLWPSELTTDWAECRVIRS